MTGWNIFRRDFFTCQKFPPNNEKRLSLLILCLHNFTLLRTSALSVDFSSWAFEQRDKTGKKLSRGIFFHFIFSFLLLHMKKHSENSQWLCMCTYRSLLGGGSPNARAVDCCFIKNAEKKHTEIFLLHACAQILVGFKWKIFFLPSARSTRHTNATRGDAPPVCRFRANVKKREKINCVLHFMDTLWRCTIHELMHNYTRCVHELGFESIKQQNCAHNKKNVAIGRWCSCASLSQASSHLPCKFLAPSIKCVSLFILISFLSRVALQ